MCESPFQAKVQPHGISLILRLEDVTDMIHGLLMEQQTVSQQTKIDIKWGFTALQFGHLIFSNYLSKLDIGPSNNNDNSSNNNDFVHNSLQRITIRSKQVSYIVKT